MPMTPTQVNAVLEAQATRPEMGKQSPDAVAELLAQEGHAAFAPADVELDDQGDKQLPATRVEGYVPEGAGELGEGDFAVPRLKIKMAGTQNADDVDDGLWFNSVDPALTAAEVTFAVLHVAPYLRFNSPHVKADKDKKKAQLAKAQNYGLNVDADHKGAYCYSEDRKTPEASDSGNVRPACRGCPARKAFDCRPGYVLIAFDLTDYGDGPANTVVAIDVSGTAVKKWKSIQSLLMARCRRGRKNFRDFVVKASTMKVDQHYLPVFESPTPVASETDEGAMLVELLADAYASFAVQQ